MPTAIAMPMPIFAVVDNPFLGFAALYAACSSSVHLPGVPDFDVVGGAGLGEWRVLRIARRGWRCAVPCTRLR